MVKLPLTLHLAHFAQAVIVNMETRQPLLPCRRRRYVSPKPACPICQRKFNFYQEVYYHTIEVHHQELDATFTCEICFRVCQNQKGLSVHRTCAHKDLPSQVSLQQGLVYQQRRLEVAAAENIGSPVPIKSAIKDEIPSSPAMPSPAELNLSPGPTDNSVTCPVCAKLFTKGEMERHIGGHDEEIAEVYFGLRNAAKAIVADLVMEITKS